jgi:hypothetical protein
LLIIGLKLSFKMLLHPEIGLGSSLHFEDNKGKRKTKSNNFLM